LEPARSIASLVFTASSCFVLPTVPSWSAIRLLKKMMIL
jgi:hypothetical protein